MNFLFKNSKARRPILFLFDVFCFFIINIFYYGSTRVFDTSPSYVYSVYVCNTAVLFVTTFVLRYFFKVYSNVWRYTSSKAYFNLILSDMTAAFVAWVISRAFDLYQGVWQFAVTSAFTVLVAIFSRLTYRLLYKHRQIAASETGPSMSARRSFGDRAC